MTGRRDRGRRSLWVAAISLAAAILGGSRAEAGDGRAIVRLEYQRADDAPMCPHAVTVRNAVAARLGYVPWSPRGRRVISAQVFRVGRSAHAARIVLRDARGRRLGRRELRFEGEDCRALADAMTLAISVAIDPYPTGPRSRVRARKPVATGPATRPPIEPAPVSANLPAPVPPRRPREEDARRPFALTVSAGGVIAVGAAPTIMSGGVTLGGRFRYERLSLALELRYDPPVFDRATAGGEFGSSAFVASVIPCAHYRWLHGCAFLSAGFLRAQGRDLLRSDPADNVQLVGAGARIGVEIPLFWRIALRIHADVFVPFVRIKIEAESRAGSNEFHTLWETPAAAGGLGAAIVFGVT